MEMWRAVPGYEGYYEVSSLGCVRSVDRVIAYRNGRKHFRKSQILSQRLNSNGRPQVSLWQNNRMKTVSVHQLVAWAFIGPQISGIEVRHMDNNPRNPSLSNLKYGTHTDNMQDRVRSGNHPMAVRAYCSNGHRFTADNTAYYRTDSNGRCCKTCNKERSRANRERRKEMKRESPS